MLYHATDSIIFSLKDVHQYIPHLGEYVGDCTYELCHNMLGYGGLICHSIEEEK